MSPSQRAGDRREPFKLRNHRNERRASSRSWDAVAGWYAGWVGKDGSRHHRLLAIPALLDLVQLRAGESLLDIGCGPGVLAPAVAAAGARYTGVDLSPKLIAIARRHHAGSGRFVVADATRLAEVPGLETGGFDAAAFLLSLQDIDPLDAAIASAALMLRPSGRLAILMTHPCFRVPRQSGWGWDEKRALRFRRVDRYLTPLAVPMQDYGGGRSGTTRSYHRPLSAYAAALHASGLVIDAMQEIAGGGMNGAHLSKAERLAEAEIPLFLALRAIKRSGAPVVTGWRR